MINIFNQFLSEKGKKFGSLILLDKYNSLNLILLLKDSNKHVFGFDGFLLLGGSQVQIDQNYSRDYSRFSQDEQYKLSEEFFRKLDSDDIFFDISFEK